MLTAGETVKLYSDDAALNGSVKDIKVSNNIILKLGFNLIISIIVTSI